MSINVLSWSYWIYEHDIIRDAGKTSSGAIDPRFTKPRPYPLPLPFLSSIYSTIKFLFKRRFSNILLTPYDLYKKLVHINYYKKILRFHINIDVIEGELISVLRKLLNRKALGLDRILNKVLKELKKKRLY